MTEEEFRQKYLVPSVTKEDPNIRWPVADIPDVELPKSFDWREHNAVTEVKKQVRGHTDCWPRIPRIWPNQKTEIII